MRCEIPSVLAYAGWYQKSTVPLVSATLAVTPSVSWNGTYSWASLICTPLPTKPGTNSLGGVVCTEAPVPVPFTGLLTAAALSTVVYSSGVGVPPGSAVLVAVGVGVLLGVFVGVG